MTGGACYCGGCYDCLSAQGIHVCPICGEEHDDGNEGDRCLEEFEADEEIVDDEGHHHFRNRFRPRRRKARRIER